VNIITSINHQWPSEAQNWELTEKEKRFFPKYITLCLYIPWVLKSVLFQIRYYIEVGWSETTLDQIIARFTWHPVQAPSYIEFTTSGHVCLFIKTPNDGELMNSQYSPQIFGKLYKKAHHHHLLLLSLCFRKLIFLM